MHLHDRENDDDDVDNDDKKAAYVELSLPPNCIVSAINVLFILLARTISETKRYPRKWIPFSPRVVEKFARELRAKRVALSPVRATAKIIKRNGALPLSAYISRLFQGDAGR